MNNDSYNNNKKPAIVFMQTVWLNANCWIRTDREWYIDNDFGIYTRISDMNLHMMGKLQCGIMTPNTKLTHGTKTENKWGKTRC